MKLGILSDTHNQTERTERAIRLLRDAGAEALIHCGDITGRDIVDLLSGLPSYFVLGNNDADNVTELKKAIASIGGTCLMWGGEVRLAERRIAIVHGHLHTDVRRSLAAEPDYMLSGHSHLASDARTGSVRRINPGALYRAKTFTVATLDLLRDELTFHTIPR